MDRTAFFVGGTWVPVERDPLVVVNPETEEPAGSVPAGTPDDVDAAVRAAAAALPAWSAVSTVDRSALLRALADGIEARTDEIARLISTEMGTPFGFSQVVQVGNPVRVLRSYADLLESYSFEEQIGNSLVVREPIGVVGAITPWNYPLHQVVAKVAAALAAGCTVVLKAAEATPGTAAEVVRALADAGAPAGAVNLVFGDPARVSERLIGAPEVRAVTFTGSTAVGRIIAGQAARGPKRVVLELGGHAPVIVDADADLELAVDATLPAKFGSAGQSCVAPSRWYVHASRYDEYVSRFTDAVRAIDVGPVIDAGRIEALERLTDDAVARGAELRCGGERVDREGFFWSPTVLCDVPADAEIMREEPFGPIAVVNRFDDLDGAIAVANSTDYAFAAYVFTDSLTTRQRAVQELRATNIGINQMAPSLPDAPLGGMQDSGVGYEGGRDGIAAFQHLRLISETVAPH
jgi:succinate-semialdehyde dehydrogenase/glutarate-semialdehyde dehydrogenase